MPTIQSNVVAAFLDSGCLKDGTAFEIASIPVIAVHPAENACKRRNSPIVSVGNGIARGTIGAAPANTTLLTPRPMSVSMLKTKI
jgi:hypothetical protein